MGILIAFVYGNYFSYYTSPYLLAIFPAVFFCLFGFLPETPPQLLKMGKPELAEKALKYFRSINSEKMPEDLMMELEKLKGDSGEEKLEETNEKVTLEDFSEYIYL